MVVEVFRITTRIVNLFRLTFYISGHDSCNLTGAVISLARNSCKLQFVFFVNVKLFVCHFLQPSKKYTSKMVTKEMSKEIHAKATPFIQWLKEAEEESSGDETDDDGGDEEVEVINCTNQLECILCSVQCQLTPYIITS